MLPGSPASEILQTMPNGSIVLEHPTGLFGAVVEVTVGPDGTPVVERSGIIRTARKLMDGVVFPRTYS
jgi:4-oxalomesaconate tautomerase